MTFDGKALQDMRVKSFKACEVCGFVFNGFKHQRFCKNACKQKAYRLNKPVKRVKVK